MNERKRVFLLIFIMAFISLIVAGVTISTLYRTAIAEEEARLIETVQSQARLIETMARFDEIYSKPHYPGGTRAATLSKIITSHNKYEQSGRTMEITLAERKGNSIIFLLRHRHGGLENHLKPVSFDSKLSESMKQALFGQSGTMIGLDYRGEVVLAAYEPVSELELGIVAKVDLAQIRAPFVKAGLIAGALAIVFIAAGASLFLRITNPMIELIEKRNAELSLKNIDLKKEIVERNRAERELQRAHDQLEKRVEQRTAELSESNRVLSQEIGERMWTEKELQESEQKYRLLVENASEGIAVAQDGFLKFVNPKLVEMSGYPEQELTACPFLDFVHPEDREIAANHYSKKLENPGATETYHIKIIDKSGEVKWIENNGIGIIWQSRPATLNFLTDITQKRLFERQLIQKEKLASLGVMVSSIAHEINNPNNFVSFNIPILRDYINEMIPIIDEHCDGRPGMEFCNLTFSEFRQDIFKLLENMENGSDRISCFVSNLRDFTLDLDMKPLIWVELKDVIEKVLSICHSKIKSSVKSFRISIPDDLPSIRTKPYALEQILLNLLINAVQASDKKDSWINLIVTVKEGARNHLCIEVGDNGCGMDEKTQLRIFDPFFTTKSPERGTGLGLFVCHTLAEELKGRIGLESEPGRGSIFRLTLPVEDQNG